MSELAIQPNVMDNGNGSAQAVCEVSLTLTLRDPEVVQELTRRAEGRERTEYALAALRLGVLALRQAGGMLDAQVVRSEGERLVGSLREAIQERSHDMLDNLNKLVRGYFDPNSGLLQQRLDRLVRKDGELEGVLSRHLNGDTSTIATTLARHIGEQSPIFRMLSPQQSDGLLAALSKTLEQTLNSQREVIVGQFSLDKDDSALSRLVRELTDNNGKLKQDLIKDLDKLFQEFSLDNEDGALSRLVGRVEQAQQTIASQFSLDDENSALSRMSKLLEATNKSIGTNLSLDDDKSPLARLRRELLNVIQDLNKNNNDFQKDVRETMAALKARKEEAARSTVHGGEFEDAVGAMLQAEAQRLNDQFEAVGDKVGRKPRCKVGDHVITMGSESAAAGTIISCEAKEKQGYTLPAAMAEIAEARENRDGQVGLFVFSQKTAPAGIEFLQRHGNDVFVIWDRDDAQTDIYLRAAVSVARALAVRQHVAESKSQAELLQLEQAIMRIAKDAERAGQIVTWAQTVKSNGQKIADQADQIREDLEKQTDGLRDYVRTMKTDSSQAAA